MKTLVITGGIGSGKSAVCAILAAKGVPVYDSDSRTKALYDNDRGLVERIEEALGVGVTDAEGRLNRRRLAEVVFSDKAQLARLEAIVHPAVLEDFLIWKSQEEKLSWPSETAGSVPFVVMESAIILEKPLFRGIADRVLVVDAPREVRALRAAERDGVSVGAVQKRMEGQSLLNAISDGAQVPEVDFVLLNTGSMEELRRKVENLLPVLWE